MLYRIKKAWFVGFEKKRDACESERVGLAVKEEVFGPLFLWMHFAGHSLGRFGAAGNGFPIGRAFLMKFLGYFIGCLFAQSFDPPVPGEEILFFRN